MRGHVLKECIRIRSFLLVEIGEIRVVDDTADRPAVVRLRELCPPILRRVRKRGFD